MKSLLPLQSCIIDYRKRGWGGGGGGLLSWTPKKVHAKVFHPKKVKMQISIPKRALHLPVTIISEYPPIPLLGNTHTVMGFLNGSGKLSLIYCCPAFLTILQSWTKLLRHSHRLGQIYALCYFVYPPPHFNVVLISKTILLE